jgi:NitT/TauT family transport system ATP-binding protein
MKDAKIRIEGVEKEFGMRDGKLSALGPIDLEVREGEFVCIVGPSGCGKSTLLNIIAGLVAPDRGKVIVDGKAVEGPGPERVMMFQESALFPWLSVRQNVEFGLRMSGVPEGQRAEVVEKYLKMVRLSHFEDSFVHELSGGMKQRVALARALAMGSSILLMDEPFAALDAQTRDRLHKELQELWAKTGKTIIFVTHNVSEAACLGDRVVVLTYRPGRIKKEFKVSLARPRKSRGSAELAKITSRALVELDEEVDKAAMEVLE